MYLLSMVTGNHTAIHLKNNKIWCTLKAVPLLHHELVKRCPIHLVYMGFGIFLQLKDRKIQEPFRILGTITSDDPEVRTHLHQLVKTEEPDEYDSFQKTNITAAAGSESQLQCLEYELSQGVRHGKCSHNVISKPEYHPKVEIMPFRVILKKLSDKTIKKYTKRSEATSIKIAKKLHLKKLSIPVKRLCLTPSQSVFLHSPRKLPSSKKVTKSTSTTKKPVKRRRLISGHPSLQQQPESVSTFQLQQHTLQRRKKKVYLKCRVPRCKLAYVTYHSVRSINAHHRTYHPGTMYTCEKCSKLLNTPTALKWHMYDHGNQAYKCDKCLKMFVYKSKLRQHRRSHIKQKLYQCCHGKCRKEYRHPQDLARHVLTHTDQFFECDLCEKMFKQKRLLRRHEAIHSNTSRYFCQWCSKGFVHNNQLYRHWKYCT